MLGRTLLVSGGMIDLEFAEDYLRENTFDTVVCADSGLQAAYRLRLQVTYFLGDFDSVSKNVLEKYQRKQIPESTEADWVIYPPEKDHTDTQLALEWAIERKPSEIVILGGTGGRFDHYLANVHLLMLPLEQGISASMLDRQNRIRLINDRLTIQRSDLFGTYISLLPMTRQVTGVTLKGFQYPLEDGILPLGQPFGVSNEFAEGVSRGEIAIRSGILAVIESRD